MTIDPLTKEELKKLKEYLLSFGKKDLDDLIKNLNNFQYLPLEILTKYLIRCYTFDTDFYKKLNKDLMSSKMLNIYKSYIKLLYLGIQKKLFSQSPNQYLYRGGKINKIEFEKIKRYKKEGKLNNLIVFSKAFLSFSEEKNEAINFIGQSDKETLGILYVLDSSKVGEDDIKSNADIQKYSAFPEEKEILFFPGSSFIISDIIELNEANIEIILNYYGKFKEYYNYCRKSDESQISKIDIDLNKEYGYIINENIIENNHPNNSILSFDIPNNKNSLDDKRTLTFPLNHEKKKDKLLSSLDYGYKGFDGFDDSLYIPNNYGKKKEQTIYSYQIYFERMTIAGKQLTFFNEKEYIIIES